MPSPRLDLRLLVRRGPPRHARPLRVCSSGRSSSCNEGARRVRGRRGRECGGRQPRFRTAGAASSSCRDGAGGGRARRLRAPLGRAGAEGARRRTPPAPRRRDRERPIPGGGWRRRDAELLDKTTGRRFEGLHALEDEPDVGDLYNFCPVDGAAPWRSDSAATARIAPRWAAPRTSSSSASPTATGAVTVTTVVRLIDGSRPRRVRHDDRQRRRGSPAPRRVPGRRARPDVRAEGQFALVHRPLSPPPPRTEWCEPPDPTQHTLGAVALGPLALLTKGLPEYEARPTDPGARALPDAAPLRRRDLAPRRRDRHPPASAPAPRPRRRRASASGATARVRAAPGRRRARRRRAAARIAGLSLRVPRAPQRRRLRSAARRSRATSCSRA